MPYITKERGRELDAGDSMRSTGDLNRQISKAFISAVKRGGLSYNTLNAISDNVKHFEDFLRDSSKLKVFLEHEVDSRLFIELESIFREYVEIHKTFAGTKGALQNAWFEFYDRVVRPYEDKAIERNGDIYGEIVELIRNK